jgi:hypothetical protein
LHAQLPEPQPLMVLDIVVSLFYAAFCAGVRGSPKSSGK